MFLDRSPCGHRRVSVAGPGKFSDLVVAPELPRRNRPLHSSQQKKRLSHHNTCLISAARSRFIDDQRQVSHHADLGSGRGLGRHAVKEGIPSARRVHDGENSGSGDARSETEGLGGVAWGMIGEKNSAAESGDRNAHDHGDHHDLTGASINHHQSSDWVTGSRIIIKIDNKIKITTAMDHCGLIST